MWWVCAVLAGPATTTEVELVVEGETLAKRHAEGYCSWATLPGITTDGGTLPKFRSFDPVYVRDRDFTGIVVMGEGGRTAAQQIEAPKSLSVPLDQTRMLLQFFEECQVQTLEASSMAELARKARGPGRALVIRALLGVHILETKCGETNRKRLFELAESCQAGKCEALADKLAWLRTDEARCVPER